MPSSSRASSRASSRILALVVAVPLIGTALAQPARPGQGGGGDGDRTANVPDPADRAMMAGMQQMNQAMSAAPMTGDPDRDFVAMMMPHHQGAIDMARVELRYGKDARLRRLAHAVVAAQRTEIAEMRRWQASHHDR